MKRDDEQACRWSPEILGIGSTAPFASKVVTLFYIIIVTY